MDRIHAPPLKGLETLSLALENVVVVSACCDDPVCNVVEVSSHSVKIKAESSFFNYVYRPVCQHEAVPMSLKGIKRSLAN